jgi:hypothetical protein
LNLPCCELREDDDPDRHHPSHDHGVRDCERAKLDLWSRCWETVMFGMRGIICVTSHRTGMFRRGGNRLGRRISRSRSGRRYREGQYDQQSSQQNEFEQSHRNSENLPAPSA